MKKPKLTKKRGVKRTAVVSVRLDRDMIKAVSDIATHLDLTRNSLIALVLHSYITERSKPDGAKPSLAALALRKKREDQNVDIFQQ